MRRNKIKKWAAALCAFIVFTASAGGQSGGLYRALTVRAQETGEADGPATEQTEILLQINEEYATPGTPLTVSLSGAPDDMACTFVWSVDGVQRATGETYTPQSGDLEKMLTVTATASGTYSGTYQASMYVSKLPVVYIDTQDGQAITSKEDYISGECRIQGNAHYNAGNTTLYDGGIQIRGRGNTTWKKPKKPYKIKLDAKTDIFGFGKNKHWVLLANYLDETHMRNMLSYDFAGAMGMAYMQSVAVDLILNGEYQGTYQFCEQVRVAGDRVDIHDWEDYAGDVAKAVCKKEQGLTKDDQDAIETYLAETDMTWLTAKRFSYKGVQYQIADYIEMPDFTGGFLMELDSYYDEISKFKTGKGQPLQFKSPEFISTNETAMQYVKDYMQAFETAIDAPDFTAAYDQKTVHYSELFDMDSIVQYWLVSEFFMNQDAMKKSTFFYKDIDGPAYMGPIWDMDWSSNSLVGRKHDSGKYDIWQTIYFHDRAQAYQWNKSIIKDPSFAVRAYEWYTRMRDEMGSIVSDGGKIDEAKALLLESANANAAKWYGQSEEKEFTRQVEELRTYLINRLDWLDKKFTSIETLAGSLGVPASYGIALKQEDIQEQPDGSVSITTDVTNTSTRNVEFIVNGKHIGVSVVENGRATALVPAEMLQYDILNVVQVYGLGVGGGVVVSGENKVTDFETFQAQKPQKPDATETPGNTQNPGSTENPGDTQNPGSTENPGNTQNPGSTENPGDTQNPGSTENPGNTQNPGGTDNSENQDNSQHKDVTSVAFSQTSVTVPKGKTAYLSVDVSAPEGADRSVAFESSDTSVVQVFDDGKVRAVKKGTAVITAKAGSLSASCTITVSEVVLNAASAPMQKGQKTTAIEVVSVYPAGDKIISWESLKPSVASVSRKGKITAKKAGNTVITVTTKSGAKASCKIRVIKGQVKTKKLAVAKKKIALKKGKTYQIKAVRTPVTANDKLSYTVKNREIVSVSSKGKVKALKKGTTKITVNAGKKKVQLQVRVK